MPILELATDELVIRLSFWQRLAAVHGDVHIPATSIRGAVVADPKWDRTIGFKVPGTAFPGFIIAGTYIKPKDSAFVYWTRSNKSVLQLNLSGRPYNRVFIGVDDAAALAEQINDAITAC
jgi:hypothetical protein